MAKAKRKKHDESDTKEGAKGGGKDLQQLITEMEMYREMKTGCRIDGRSTLSSS